MMVSTVNRDKIAQVYLGLVSDKDTQEKTKARIDWLVDQIQGSDVLDIGCSEGILPILLGRKGITVTGIDINPDAIKFANELLQKENNATINRVTFICADFQNYEMNNKKFSYVVTGEIIEHLENPEPLISKSIACLKPGGKLLVTTPLGYFPDPDHRYTFKLTKFLEFYKAFNVTPSSLSIEHGYIRFIAINKEDRNHSWAKLEDLLLQMEEDEFLKEQHEFYRKINLLRSENLNLVESNNRLQNSYKNLQKSYHEMVNRIAFKTLSAISDAFNQFGIKTIKLPFVLLKLFIEW